MVSLFAFSGHRSRIFISAAVVLFIFQCAAHAQKVDKEKFDTGIRRAVNAAKALTDLAALAPGDGIPKDLIAKARVIAVFPNVTKINVLFQKGMKGYGLAARRTDGGWSMPAFYGFGVSDKGWTKVKSESPGIIMLFMDDAAIKAFEKDHIAIAGAVAGPVGDVDVEGVKKAAGASLIIYAIGDDSLKGVSVADDSSAMSGLGMDNNINKAVFGLKGNEVFWGKTPLPSPIPVEITAFQNALVALTRH